ncbi:MAG: MBL fold metallo-hydrolase [Deltaproteobacteria bacterium]|nr:MBL fold metallo-hydrolase [Deltaproteobacteria bacterium]
MPLPVLPQRGEFDLNQPASDKVEDGSKLEIYLPDVGQGDATLLRSPGGKTLLIDAGPPSAAQGRLLPFLRELKIQRLDALLVTHYDLDHLGGVPSLLAGKDGEIGTPDDIAVGIAYDRGGTPWDNSPGFGDYLAALAEAGIPRQSVEAGQSLPLDEAVEIRCLAANGVVAAPGGTPVTVDLTPATYVGKENAASIALLVEFGDFRYLTAGDLTGGGSLDGFLMPDVESVLAESTGRVDVVHANHHGSLSSSNASFVEATAPSAVMVQAGKDNNYGHPNPEVLSRWRSIGAEVHSTAEGTGFRLEIWGNGFEILPIAP